MRAFATAACAALLALAAGAWPAAAQEEPAPEPASPTAGPVPYTSLLPKPAPKPRPAPRRLAPPPPVAPPPQPLPARAAAGARLGPGQPIPALELEAFVDGVMRQAMADEHIVGATVAVVQNGQVVLKKGYGYASLTPARRVDPERTLFRIGSISKTFTWIAVMREVEAGRLRLNAPVNLYLPERVQVRDQGWRNPVRVRHLLSHSAGFEDRALGQLMERSAARERPLLAYLRQERPRRVHPAGAVSSYSNYGAALAGAAVAYVADESFERHMEETLFLPLGMRSTTFREPRPVRAGLPAPMPQPLASQVAAGYRWTPTGYQPRPHEFLGHIAPAGSASSTAADMARYMQLLLNGGTLEGRTIYGPRTAQAFRTPLRRAPQGVNGWPHGFVQRSLPGGYTGLGHDGATLSFMSNMVLVPSLNLGIFVSANTDTAAGLQARLPEAVIGQFYAPPAPLRTGDRALGDHAGLYQGYYLGSRRAHRGLEGFIGRLISGAQVSVTPQGLLVTAMGGEVRTWRPEGDAAGGRFVATDREERLVFTLEDGRATGFLPSSGAALYARGGFWDQPSVLGLFALLTGVAALATLAGAIARTRREGRETPVQSRASLVQNTEAVLWLLSLVLFAVWVAGAADVARVMFEWPGPALIVASACALVASLLNLVSLALAPAVWRGGRRVDSWPPLRRAGYTLTALIYLTFSVLLGLFGALLPWSG